jgi:DNA (cytosine-5)-methyltransferase 1
MAQRQYPKTRPRIADLFCGAGGMSLGFEQAGFDIAVGIEADGHHVAAHHRNFPYSKTVCTSVTTVDAAKMREFAGGDEIDVIIGGPPCQGFSNMGHRDAADARNSLIGEFARIVLDVRPKAFVMENVPAILSGDTRPLLDRVIEMFEEGGYTITKPLRVLTASDFGVPQARSRLFVLGLRSDLPGKIDYPDGPCPDQPARPTVLEAIGDLPDIERSEKLFKCDLAKYDKKPQSAYARIARGVEADPSDASYPRGWKTSLCSGCLRTAHAEASVALYRATPPGVMVPGHKLPRLDPGGLAPTLRAGSDSTRGSYTAPRPIHPLLPRCITTREAARLHGYPDWFMFFPTKWHAYKQVGNSVCPPVARAVGRQVMKALGIEWTGKTPAPIELADDFELPEDRPRQHKRIPQMLQYPPVIAHLFETRFDKGRRKLKDSRFTFADVQSAISATGVDLSWTRSDTFLSEVARSRNVKRFLQVPLSHGYSVRKLEGSAWIGEFVPVGTADALDRRGPWNIRVEDLSNAVQISMPTRQLNQLAFGIHELLDDPLVRGEMWPGDVVGVEPAGDTSKRSPSLRFLHVLHKGGRFDACAVLLCGPESVPEISRIERLAKRERIDQIVSVTPLTSKHLLIARYSRTGKSMKEVARRVFLSDEAETADQQILLFA